MSRVEHHCDVRPQSEQGGALATATPVALLPVMAMRHLPVAPSHPSAGGAAALSRSAA